ncbi:hypothetical protein F0562_029122 [Nyssa sinensis]|uniref:Uncharacterized protein n=1 Tax=Nyssa sinensis TaxID=561372 RepID=A0A5J5B248_9ASTE|nr:hypothetical protein F0562_029122 [Nyssa sinensis]
MHQHWRECDITISNNSKDLKWSYSPTFMGLPNGDKDMMWLSNWKIGNQLGGGDDVIVTVSLGAIFQLKEIGIDIVYEEEDKGLQYDTYASCQNVIDVGDLAAYQLETGWYHLCHHRYEIHQFHSRRTWGQSLKKAGAQPEHQGKASINTVCSVSLSCIWLQDL